MVDHVVVRGGLQVGVMRGQADDAEDCGDGS
jgi:hypothetical protein